MEIANKTTRNNVKNIHDVEMMIKLKGAPNDPQLEYDKLNKSSSQKQNNLLLLFYRNSISKLKYCSKTIERFSLKLKIIIFLVILIIIFSISNVILEFNYDTANLHFIDKFSHSFISKKNSSTHINVGFFTHNLEALKYEKEDLNLILETFSKIISMIENNSKKKNLKKIENFLNDNNLEERNTIKDLNQKQKGSKVYNKNKNDDMLIDITNLNKINKLKENYDILFFSFQEIAEEKKLKPVFKSLVEIGFKCDSVQSNSSIRKLNKVFIGYKATYVVICHNTLKLNFIGNHRLSDPKRSKSIHGGCYETIYKNTIKDTKYCFFGIHAQMVYEKSIPSFIDLINSINLKYENSVVYILGDTNVRSYQTNFYDENLKLKELSKEEDFKFLYDILWKKLFEDGNKKISFYNNNEKKLIQDLKDDKKYYFRKEDYIFMENINLTDIDNNTYKENFSFIESSENKYKNGTKIFNEVDYKNHLSKNIIDEILKKNRELYIEGDELSVNFFKNYFEKEMENFNIIKKLSFNNTMNTTNNNSLYIGYENLNNTSNTFVDSKINFLGNENLRKLPPTYKYESAPKRHERSNFKYNLKLISNKQKIFKEEKAYKFGLLDRLICFAPNNKFFENCKVDNDEVNYFMVPELRVSDHMPLAGNFRITIDTK